MTTLLRFPLSLHLPELPVHVLENALSTREWDTYAIGVRIKDEAQKQSILKVVRTRVANLSLFNGKKLAFEFPDVEIIFDEVEKEIRVQVQPVIITGRYTKLQRTIAQTRHFCYQCKGTGRFSGGVCEVCKGEKVLTKESVQELIAPFFQKHFGCEEVLFHGAGREDVDVRMLGKGRPFALTLENPMKRTTDVPALMNEINAVLKNKVELFNLELGMPLDVAHVTQKYHTKRYRALVEGVGKVHVERLDSFLNQKMDVIQVTPVRVEKRRAMKERPHWVILESVKKIDETHVEITLHASAGCYIKEFISGDEGRSKPSLSEWLNCACVCKELDVVEIVEEAVGGFSVVS